MPPGYEMIIPVCLCVFRSNYKCNVCHSPAHDRVITSAHSEQTSDCRYFWFPSNLKDKPECHAGFLQRGDAVLLHAEEVKYIKRSSAGDLGLGRMLIPFFHAALQRMFSNEGRERAKVSGLNIYFPGYLEKRK